MDETARFEISPDEAARIQAAIQACILEMQRANERMKKDQEEIERLRAKTRAMLAELEAS
jgi:hypothetical protein